MCAPLFTPKTLKSFDIQQQIIDLKPDIIVVVAYGAILPQKILDIPKWGCINVHGSILPKWRGAAPIERAVEAGDIETGVAIMQMEAALDTGPVAMLSTVPINNLNSLELREILSQKGASLLIEALRKIEDNTICFEPQIGKATYANKISKNETKLNWEFSATELEQKIRAFAPNPGAWCEMLLSPQQAVAHESRPERVKILSAQVTEQAGALSKKCSDNLYLTIKSCQKAGGKILKAEQFIAGYSKIEII